LFRSMFMQYTGTASLWIFGGDTISMETLQTSIVLDHSYGCKVKFSRLHFNWIWMCVCLLLVEARINFRKFLKSRKVCNPPPQPVFIANERTTAICFENARIPSWIENPSVNQVTI
jgi:hypothetical protein